MPAVSIIVPVYNVEPYLEFCVESLRAQTLKDIEIILVDDGSSDRSGEICDRLGKQDQRIRVLHKSNGGLSSARNAGIAVAKGDYIGFVDSDDWVESDMYAYLFNLITKHQADIADCEMLETSDRKFVKLQSKEEVELLDRDAAYRIFFRVSKTGIHYCVCDKLFKRELFADTLFTEGIIFEDIDFNYRVLLHAQRIVNSNQVKYYYFKNNSGISRNSFRKKDLDLLCVWDNIIELCKMHTPAFTKWAVFNRQRADFGLLCKMCKYGCREKTEEYDHIRKMLLKSLRSNYKDLIIGKLPLNRKVVLTLMTINYYLVAVPFKIKRRLTRGTHG